MLPGSEQRLLCRRATCHFYIMQSLPKYWLPIKSLKSMGLSKTGGHRKIESLGGNITDQMWKFSEICRYQPHFKNGQKPHEPNTSNAVQTDAFCKAVWMKSNFSLQFFPSWSSSQLNKIVPSTSSTDTMSCQLHEL